MENFTYYTDSTYYGKTVELKLDNHTDTLYLVKRYKCCNKELENVCRAGDNEFCSIKCATHFMEEK